MPFKSKAQARLFYARAKKSPKWKKMADEFSSKTDWGSLRSRIVKHLSGK